MSVQLRAADEFTHECPGNDARSTLRASSNHVQPELGYNAARRRRHNGARDSDARPSRLTGCTMTLNGCPGAGMAGVARCPSHASLVAAPVSPGASVGR